MNSLNWEVLERTWETSKVSSPPSGSGISSKFEVSASPCNSGTTGATAVENKRWIVNYNSKGYLTPVAGGQNSSTLRVVRGD